jgi:hypothetical protein
MSAPRLFTAFVATTLFALTLCGHAQTQATCTFTYFNPPSGYTGDFWPTGINHYNTVVGGVDTTVANSLEKGFTRYSGGGVSLFAVPNAIFTQLNKRNLNGTSVGYYDTNGGAYTHGLILTSSSYTTLDYPNALSTALNGINKWNTIVGTEVDPSTTGQVGFKYQNNRFTAIKYPGAVQTSITSINDNGVIVGGYEKGSFENPWSGYILQNGVFKSLSYIPLDINNAGTMVDGQNIHFANGTVKKVVVPGAFEDFVRGINDLGVITGSANYGPNSQGNFTWKGFTAVCH